MYKKAEELTLRLRDESISEIFIDDLGTIELIANPAFTKAQIIFCNFNIVFVSVSDGRRQCKEQHNSCFCGSFR